MATHGANITSSQQTQNISSTFYIPQPPSPSAATLARATSVGHESIASSAAAPTSMASATSSINLAIGQAAGSGNAASSGTAASSGSAQPASVRQTISGLQKKVSSGGIRGVVLESVNYLASGPRCVASCSADLGALSDLRAPQSIIRKVAKGFTYRVYIDYVLGATDIQHATVPKFRIHHITNAKELHCQRLLGSLQNLLQKYSARRVPNHTEAVLRNIVSHITHDVREYIMRMENGESLTEEADIPATPPIHASAFRSGHNNISSTMFQMEMQQDTQNRNRARPLAGMTARRTTSTGSTASNPYDPLARKPSAIENVRTPSESGLSHRSSSTDSSGMDTAFQQPCPRFAGATFSGPGLLVAYSSGITERLQQIANSPRSSRRHHISRFISRDQQLIDDESPDTAGGLPRTYRELTEMLQSESSFGASRHSGLDKRLIQNGVSITSAPSMEDALIGPRTNGKLGIAEDITSEDLFDLSVRRASQQNLIQQQQQQLLQQQQSSQSLQAQTSQGQDSTVEGASSLSPRNPAGSQQSTPVLDTSSNLDDGTFLTKDSSSVLQRRVVILDASLLSPIQRFLGRALRIGALNSLPNKDLATQLMLKDAHSGMTPNAKRLQNGIEGGEDTIQRDKNDVLGSGVHDDFDEDGNNEVTEEDEDESEDDEDESFEALLCWWDDFSDEPTSQWDGLPLHTANMQASHTVGRFDLVQTWLMMRCICSPDIAEYENNFTRVLGSSSRSAELGERWAMHPCGRRLISRIIDELARTKDVQTLATLSCVLEEESSHDKWSHTLPLMDPSHKAQYDRFRRAYASILHRWGLNTKRAEVMKYVDPDPSLVEDEMVKIASACGICSSQSPSMQCDKPSCRAKGSGLQCTICNRMVLGLCTFCPLCGHGGHAQHMSDWFAESDECPSGCGCRCGELIK